MSRHAWVYIYCVLASAGILLLPGLAQMRPSSGGWLTLAVLVALAVLTQLLEAVAPSRQSYYPHLIFFFTGLLLLQPGQFALLVVVPHVVEWATKRVTHSPNLHAWYIQPFNIGTHIIAGAAARLAYMLLTTSQPLLSTAAALPAVACAAATYVVVNHLLIGLVLLLARGISFRKSAILALDSVLPDLIQLLLGYVLAVLWQLDRWLILPGLAPLVVIYQALKVPQLKQEAQTDGKTGLVNAGYFNKLLRAEIERAQRFNRPLAVLVADLDLLRNINNTYGHLAGDVVIAGIGQILRENIREYDIAARFGGEEFAILLPEVDPGEAREIADRLRQKVEAASFVVKTSSSPTHVTVSVGLACFPRDAAPGDLMHLADVAVYQAKLQGRNRVVSMLEVPHSVVLGTLPEEAASVMANGGAACSVQPTEASPASPSQPLSLPPLLAGQAQPISDPPAVLWPLLITVIAAGAGAVVAGVWSRPAFDPVAVVLLAGLAAAAEVLHLRQGESSVSVSVALNFAAAVLAGIPGVACVSLAIALANRLSQPVGKTGWWPAVYRTAFNWAVHVLAGSTVALAFTSMPLTLEPARLPLFLFSAVAGTMTMYVIDTGLIAAAIGLSSGKNILAGWHDEFSWLALHYLVLGLLGLFVAMACTALGALSIVMFALPIFMMRYAEKQYIGRTESLVCELRRMNVELSMANGEVARSSQVITRLNDELFHVLAQVIDARDSRVYGHSSRVAECAMGVAAAIGLPAERREQLRQAALLHDIGKISISDKILQKPGKLNGAQYRRIQSHASVGAGFLQTCTGLQHLAPFIRHHHEWWNGNGYPDGLQGEEIPLEARILSVCDAAEAMTSHRSYLQPRSNDDAVAEISHCAGTQFDPAVCQAFVRFIQSDTGQQLMQTAGPTYPVKDGCASRGRRPEAGPAPIGRYVLTGGRRL